MSKNERESLVPICCDYLGISKIDQEAQQAVEHYNREFIKRTIRLAKKWANRSGRKHIQISDLLNAIHVLDGSGFAKSLVPLTDTLNLGVENLQPVPGSTNLFARPNRDTEIDGTGKSFGNVPIPVHERIRAYFLVTDGILTKSPYTLNLSEEDIEDDDDDGNPGPSSSRKAEKFADHSVKFDTSATKMYLQALKTTKNEQIVGLKPNAVEALSVEQQAYMKEFLHTSMAPDDKKRQDALRSFENDAGLQHMLPHIVQVIQRCLMCWTRPAMKTDLKATTEVLLPSSMSAAKCVDKIVSNIAQKSMSLIIYGCRILRCISLNTTVDLSLQLHIIFPLLLSCIIGRSEDLCSRPDVDNHWILRDYAAKTLVLIFKSHVRPEHYSNLRTRVVQYAYNVLIAENSSAAVVYGASYVMTELVEDERIEWLLHLFSSLLTKHKNIYTDLVQRPHAQLMAQDSLRLHQQIIKHDAVLRKRLQKDME